MDYITADQFQDAFGVKEYNQLITKDEVANPDTFIDANANTTSIIDTALGGLYVIPFIVVPEVLQRVALDICRYYLHDQHRNDIVDENYEKAILMLDKIASGKYNLVGVDKKDDAISTNPTAKPQTIAPAKRFTESFFEDLP